MATPAPAAEKEIKVTIGIEAGKLKVSPDPFRVRKHQDQVLRWVCTADGGEFTVEFGSDCPFYETQFNKDHPCSGLVRRNVVTDPKRIYKYTVRVGDNFLDPGGGVEK